MNCNRIVAHVNVEPDIFFGPDGDKYFGSVFCVDERVVREILHQVGKKIPLLEPIRCFQN